MFATRIRASGGEVATIVAGETKFAKYNNGRKRVGREQVNRTRQKMQKPNRQDRGIEDEM